MCLKSYRWKQGRLRESYYCFILKSFSVFLINSLIWNSFVQHTWKITNICCMGWYWYMYAVVVQLPSHVQLFVTPWTAACQASLSLTVSQSLPKVMFTAPGDTIQPSLPLTPSRAWVLWGKNGCRRYILPLVYSPDAGKDLGAGGEGGDRGWDG